MPQREKVKEVFSKAKELEKKYDWLAAADFYHKALSFALRKKDFLKAGEIHARIGFCFCRAALQAETNKDFKKRTFLAIEAYEKAVEEYGKVKETRDVLAKTQRCRARIAYVSSRLSKNVAERRQFLDKCWGLTKESMKNFRETGKNLQYGVVLNELLECLLDRYDIEQNWSNRKKILREGLDYSEKAIATFEELADKYELTRAYYLTSLHCFWAARYSEPALG
jgi:hypothetical protein